VLQSGLHVRLSVGSVAHRRIAHARALQLEAIEQNSEILGMLGNLDGMDRSVGAPVRSPFSFVCAGACLWAC
jgi:hypothetical protein